MMEIRKGYRGFILFMLLPAVILVFVTIIFPIVLAFFLSFNKATITGMGISANFTGLSNYTYVFKYPLFWESLRTTSYFTFVSLSIELVLGTLIALLLNKDFIGNKILRAIVLLPWAVPTVVNARMWQWILAGENYGAFNKLFMQMHLIKEPVVWLGFDVPFHNVPLIGNFLEWIGATRALNMIILGDTWKVTPLVALLVLAGLQTIPNALYEAASIDGASKWDQFWNITVPLLRPIWIVILVLRTMELFRVFDIIYIIMGYKIKVLSILTFEEGMVFTHLGKGASLSFIIGGIILLIGLFYIRILREKEVKS